MIIGCDFRTRYQQIAMLDDATGEPTERRLDYQSGRVAHPFSDWRRSRLSSQQQCAVRQPFALFAKDARVSSCGRRLVPWLEFTTQ